MRPNGGDTPTIVISILWWTTATSNADCSSKLSHVLRFTYIHQRTWAEFYFRLVGSWVCFFSLSLDLFCFTFFFVFFSTEKHLKWMTLARYKMQKSQHTINKIFTLNRGEGRRYNPTEILYSKLVGVGGIHRENDWRWIEEGIRGFWWRKANANVWLPAINHCATTINKVVVKWGQPNK